ncbi:MAG: hypothetical protein ABIP49_01140 [Lysobacterales bacterium]
MRSGIVGVCGVLVAIWLCLGKAQAAVFSGIEYGHDRVHPLLLDVRTQSKPGPFPVWVEWVERDASPLIVPDREVHAADTVLIRAVMPSNVAARSAAAAQLLTWLPASVSGYGGDPEHMALIVHGEGAQSLLDLWNGKDAASMPLPPARSVRALILVAPPASLRGHRSWPDLPLLLIDAPARADALWRIAIGLRNQGIAAEPVVQGDPASAALGLSTHIAAMLAASDVPRVQRFDQLAFEAPISIEGRLLDAVQHTSGLMALLWDAPASAVRLVSIDAVGTTREVRRWPWRDDSRLVAIEGRLLAIGSDARGRPQIALGPIKGSDWISIPTLPVLAPVRLVAISQRGGEIALAWSRTDGRGDAAAWLQRILLVESVPRLITSRLLTRIVRAVTFSGEDVIAALAPLKPDAGTDRRGAASLMRWTESDGRWLAVADTGTAPWDALWALSPDGAPAESSQTALGLRGGHMHTVDLSCIPICVREEIDFDALVAASRLGAAAVSTGARAGREKNAGSAPATQWLRHPETGESLLALMPAPAPGSASRDVGAAWLIRQSSGRYGFARLPLPEGRGAGSGFSLRALQPWPTAADPNRFAVFARHGARTLLFAARLQRSSSVVPGLWWDPARSGHGFDLRRAGDGWQVTIYTFDTRGEPIWLRGEGEIREGRWHASSEGLLKYRMRPGSTAVAIDRRNAQSLEIAFGPEVDSDRCPGAASTRGQATLVVADAVSVFCIEPLRLAVNGRPQIDLDGVWSAREDSVPWQLSLTTQGNDPRSRISAMFSYFDRRGAPRWAYAANDWRDGVAQLPLLRVRGACAECAAQPFTSTAIGELSLRATGECGAIRLVASLRMGGDGAIGAPVGNVGLAPTSLLGCY